MKTYTIRVEKTQVGYYNVQCKSLEEAKAQAEYQMTVNSQMTIHFDKCEEINLPKESMIIDQDYLEFTNKGEKNG
tara:strand:+ start:561 stop:785 length:225 start_codon:yes stop_codon:yes gene_type:complete